VGRIDFWAWHVFVAATSLVAASLVVSSRRLRLHSAAILVSGLVWAAMFLLALPALAAHGTGDQDLGSAVGDSVMADCCGLALGSYHLLLCGTLGLEALRIMQRSIRSGVD
jgi:hypothetical protein